jgi:alkaline phosphatase D
MRQKRAHQRQPLMIALFAATLLTLGRQTLIAEGPCFGEGVKIGEVTPTSAILWTRLCATDQCDADYSLPGMAGEVRLVYRPADASEVPARTGWAKVDPEKDYTCRFEVAGLQPATDYTFTLEARNADRERRLTGGFRTAPRPDRPAKVRFTVVTGQKWKTIDEPGKGQKIYQSMLRLNPDFLVHTGDVVYYDNDAAPLATNEELARLHWHRLYSLPYLKEFHRRVPGYFMKDDHDILKNDCWPGQKHGELTFARGVELFKEQVPMGERPYRTVRWGKDLQLWMVEGREFRTANHIPDGPEKTIWGREQIGWFKRTVEASDATFKLLITPTPIVGPDRTDGSKNDNLSNKGFTYEGDRIRQWLAAQKNMFVATGDRHWQYASVDDKTKLKEFSCGPTTDAHAGGWKQDDVRAEHRFLRVKGGFLSVLVERREATPGITFRLHDVDGRVVYEETIHAAAKTANTGREAAQP